MPVTLCLMLSAREPRETVKYPLTERKTVLSVPARHVIDRVTPAADDAEELCVWIDVATEPARPVDIRLELIAAGDDAPPRSHLLGRGVWRAWRSTSTGPT
jgi:hypothetical protein